MKSLLFTALVAFGFAAAAFSGNAYYKHAKLSAHDVDGIAVTLSEEETVQALAQVSAVLLDLPDSYMLVIREAVLDIAEGKYYLLYDLYNEKNEMISSIAEPMHKGEDGQLFLATSW
jgi:hypothetical protein